MGQVDDLGLHFIRGEFPLQDLEDFCLFLFPIHIDEIGHDDAPDIPQPQLPGDFPGSFPVGG